MTARDRFPSEEAERVQIRMPDGMRDELKLVAESNGRSMNAEIIYRLKQVGPAGAATPPSRGSNILGKNEMNENDAITAGARPASVPVPFPGYQGAFQALDAPLQEARQMAKLLDRIADDLLEVEGQPTTPEEERRRYETFASMVFLARQTRRSIEAVDALWTGFEKAGADMQLAESMERSREGSR